MHRLLNLKLTLNKDASRSAFACDCLTRNLRFSRRNSKTLSLVLSILSRSRVHFQLHFLQLSRAFRVEINLEPSTLLKLPFILIINWRKTSLSKTGSSFWHNTTFCFWYKRRQNMYFCCLKGSEFFFHFRRKEITGTYLSDYFGNYYSFSYFIIKWMNFGNFLISFF